MDHFIEIYRNQAQQYHSMISVEDIDNNLLKTIEKFTSLENGNILDLGSGTGRLPLLFWQINSKIIGLDISFQMLAEQQVQRDQMHGSWDLTQGDIRHLPIQNAWADITTAGWAAGHFCGWYPDRWQPEIDDFVSEMLRVTKPSGTLFIMETLGTGKEIPAPPTAMLALYYAHLESKWGFTREQIRTDYKFRDVEDAKQQTTFFFGQTLAEQIEENHWHILPEWTGVWHRKQSLG